MQLIPPVPPCDFQSKTHGQIQDRRNEIRFSIREKTELDC